MPRPIVMTVPNDDELRQLLQQSLPYRCEQDDVERFLRRLHGQYPESRLLVSVPVTLIETSCGTGARTPQRGHIAIIERTDVRDDRHRYLLSLLGGPTGHESFYVPPSYVYTDWGKSGWSACAGTPGRWNACYVPPASMMAVGVAFLPAVLGTPSVTYPSPLTPAEQDARLLAAKERFMAGLRNASASHSSATDGPRP